MHFIHGLADAINFASLLLLVPILKMSGRKCWKKILTGTLFIVDFTFGATPVFSRPVKALHYLF